jgi:signal transduction histidine kinase
LLVTKTIRRKMLFWLGLLVLLMGGLSVSSIQGLRSYRQTVKDLDFSISHAPRKAELVEAIASLIQPLRITVPLQPYETYLRVSQLQYEEFAMRLAEAREEIADFERKLSGLESSTNPISYEDSVHRALIGQLRSHFDHIEGEVKCLAGAPLLSLERDQHVASITKQLAELIGNLQNIPDPSSELTERLETATSEYRWHLSFVWTTGLSSLAMLAVLVFFAHRWVIAPLSCLHQGALRVADGDDFDFRIDAKTGDEISELAGAFNKMTARFQAVTADLDAQVQQRSRQLVQSERLAGVGFLSAGVAHEINNPLSAIVGAADSLEWRLSEHLDKFPEAEAAVIREYLGMMQSEAQRCRKITEKLLDFARGTDTERNQYDVTAIVQEVVAMTHHLGRFRDRKVTIDRTTPCYAWVNGPEIKQVMLNLVANALEATRENGQVSIRLHDCPNHIEITVTDDGIGMGPDVLQHIFEPFFTRREAGKGTGLGLSISHRIVEDHGGSLEASSEGAEKGSTFRLRLPTRPRGAGLSGITNIASAA